MDYGVGDHNGFAVMLSPRVWAWAEAEHQPLALTHSCDASAGMWLVALPM